MSIDSPVLTPRVRVARLSLVALVLALVGACTTAPLSYLNDRQVTQRAMLHRYPVVVTAIDGSSTTFKPVPIAPGVHQVAMDAPAVGGFSYPVRKVYSMTIEPCTRYYIAAQRQAALQQDWDLVVEVTYPVAGCSPGQELEKARVAQSSTLQSSSVATIDPAKTANLPATGISQ